MLTFSKISVCESCDNDKWGLLIPNQTMQVCKLSSEAFIHVTYRERRNTWNMEILLLPYFSRVTSQHVVCVAFRTLREGHVGLDQELCIQISSHWNANRTGEMQWFPTSPPMRYCRIIRIAFQTNEEHAQVPLLALSYPNQLRGLLCSAPLQSWRPQRLLSQVAHCNSSRPCSEPRLNKFRVVQVGAGLAVPYCTWLYPSELGQSKVMPI